MQNYIEIKTLRKNLERYVDIVVEGSIIACRQHVLFYVREEDYSLYRKLRKGK